MRYQRVLRVVQHQVVDGLMQVERLGESVPDGGALNQAMVHFVVGPETEAGSVNPCSTARRDSDFRATAKNDSGATRRHNL